MFSKILTPVLMRVYPCTIEEVRHNTQKERRIIDTLEPVMNKHRLVFNSEVIKEDLRVFKGDVEGSLTGETFKYSLFYQMTHITKDRGCLRHDDRLDALAMAVAYWVESMGKDEDQALKDYNERMLDEDLKSFMEMKSVKVGASSNDSRWFRV